MTRTSFARWIAAAFLALTGCAAQTAYYGPNAASMADPATIEVWQRGPFSLTPDLFRVVQIDGEDVPESRVTGTAGVTLALDDSEHRVRLLASHMSPGRQIVGTGEVVIRPVPGGTYMPYGQMEGDTWVLWVSEKQTGQPVSQAVRVQSRVVAVAQAPNIAPMIPFIVGH